MIDESVEHNGQYVVSIVESAGDVSPVFARKTRDILADHGIENPSADEWYPSQAVLETLSELDEEVGSKTVEQAGRAMAENAPWPDDISDPAAAVELLNELHHGAVRNTTGDPSEAVGAYSLESTEDGSVRVAIDDSYPWPKALAAGVLGQSISMFSGGVVDRADASPRSGERAAWTFTW